MTKKSKILNRVVKSSLQAAGTTIVCCPATFLRRDGDTKGEAKLEQRERVEVISPNLGGIRLGSIPRGHFLSLYCFVLVQGNLSQNGKSAGARTSLVYGDVSDAAKFCLEEKFT